MRAAERYANKTGAYCSSKSVLMQLEKAIYRSSLGYTEFWATQCETAEFALTSSVRAVRSTWGMWKRELNKMIFCPDEGQDDRCKVINTFSIHIYFF